MKKPDEYKVQLKNAQADLEKKLIVPDVDYFSLFDAQGFYVNCEPSLDAKQLTAIHVTTLNPEHLNKFTESLSDTLDSTQLVYNLDKAQIQQLTKFKKKNIDRENFLKALNKLYKSDSSAVINLERAMRFKLTQVAQSVLVACSGKKALIERCYEQTLKSFFAKNEIAICFCTYSCL